jgi:hypothetical protein
VIVIIIIIRTIIIIIVIIIIIIIIIINLVGDLGDDDADATRLQRPPRTDKHKAVVASGVDLQRVP